MKISYTILLSLIMAVTCSAQEFKKPVKLELDATGTVLVENIFGDVKVVGYDGDKVLVTGEITLEARTTEKLEMGKEEFSIDAAKRNDSLLIFNKAPFITNRFSEVRERWWGNNGQEPDYRFLVHLEVKVPKKTNLWVSTVNDGKVKVVEVSGAIQASNVNGPVALENVEKVVKAKAVNGNIDITYNNLPGSDSDFKTVNGDIIINVGSALNTTVEFESMNGDLYTDFEYSGMGPEIKKVQDRRGGKTKYKIEATTKIKIGAGDQAISFNTINGNMYIKKI
ncbi:MAG: hypothetical protein NXI20_04710 [bacterium]|nr:hypothetical protein [bacterium]